MKQNYNKIFEYKDYKIYINIDIDIIKMLFKTFEHVDELDIFMNDHKFIIINVSAAWCKPCKSIAPELEKFIQNIECNDSFLFLKCDYDIISEFQSFIDEYYVQKIPYFIFIDRGTMSDSLTGSNIDQIKNKINDFIIKNSPISNKSFENSDF
jgi:thiol-disulfide isomerase/thioredoxin